MREGRKRVVLPKVGMVIQSMKKEDRLNVVTLKEGGICTAHEAAKVLRLLERKGLLKSNPVGTQFRKSEDFSLEAVLDLVQFKI